MDKVKAKAKAWEAEFQRTCQPKKVVCIGCVWVGGREKKAEEEDEDFLSRFSALVLTNKAPVQVEPANIPVQLDNQGTVERPIFLSHFGRVHVYHSVYPVQL